jgi:hypothetical protein
MRSGIVIIMVWLCFGTIEAQQKIEKHLDFTGKQSTILKIQIADSIIIRTWNKNEVFVTASFNINENKDNDAYQVSFNETGNNILINGNFKDQYFKQNNNCCNTARIFWQLYLPERTAFTLETINGNITIEGQTEKMKVKSISGYIDLSMPLNRKADLKLSTISGTIYSNFVFQRYGSSGIPVKIEEKLNNGGPLVDLETISGDIFFRKSE